ncbi:DgyrCDS12444 [Dimorphilus gyrociliatus]|uniref:DgyrCDS12444 n=1 Tax=Dimorphilus gyrociliatus TaxID=2664684 RepID=A0A7I8W871_9ANNE|nr:DgyrCDS12444 [Dimorphilus gyrociliatus]
MNSLKLLTCIWLLTFIAVGLIDASDDCFERYEGWYLEQGNVEERFEKNAHDCKVACLNANYKCASVQYDRSTGLCSLSLETKDTRPLYYKSSHNYIYWQRRSDCHANCYIKSLKGGHLLQAKRKIIKNRTFLECQEACFLAKDFNCKAASYDSKHNICYLSEKTRDSPNSPFKINVENLWYFEKVCHSYPCYEAYDNIKLNIHESTSLPSLSLENCLETCLQNRNCHSVQYNKFLKICYLSKEIRSESPKKNYIKHQNYIYFEKNKHCLSNCKLNRYDNRYLDGSYAKKYDDIKSDLECLKLCLTFGGKCSYCKSIQYDKKSEICYLSEETHITKKDEFKSNKNFVYWYRNHECDSNCYYEYSMGKYLSGYSNRILKKHTILQCMEACYTIDEFHCKSFDYDSKLKQCKLSSESKFTKHESFKDHKVFGHYHKICKSNYPCFKTYANRYMDDDFYTYTDKTEDECVKQCIIGEVPCKSVSYNKKTKTCYLSRKTKDSHPKFYKDNDYYNYFEKEDYCQPECIAIPFPGYFLSSHQIDSLKTKSEIECVKTCLKTKPFGSCISVDWDYKTKQCNLHDETRISKYSSFQQSKSHIHWHIDCGDECFDEYPYRSLRNHHIETISDSSEEHCKSSCLKSVKGCRSAEYDKDTEICYISRETKKSKPDSYQLSKNRIYWERKHVCQPECYFTEHNNRYLLGQNKKQAKVQNELECKQLCLREEKFSCLSAYYNKKTNVCYLSEETHNRKPLLWKENTQYKYWEKICARNYPCFNHVNGKYLKEKYYLSKFGLTEEQCLFLCKRSLCKSANYNRKTKMCYISKSTSKHYPKAFNNHNSYVYFEKKSSCNPDCYHKRYANSYLVGSYELVKQVSSEDECLKLCLNKPNLCKSLNYHKLQKKCYLSRYTSSQNAKNLKNSINYIYYEQTCEDDSNHYSCFTSHNNQYLIGYNKKILNKQTEESCLYSCLTANFICRSAEYSKTSKKCYLSMESRKTKPNHYHHHSSYKYFNRNEECFKNCPVQTFLNRILENWNIIKLKTASDLECLSECLTTRSCSSVHRNMWVLSQKSPSSLYSSNASKYYEMFYLKPGCAMEELMSAHQTMVRRNSNNLQLVNEFNRAFEIVKNDISKQKSPRNKSKNSKYSQKTMSFSGGIDSMVNSLVEQSLKQTDMKNLKGAGKPLKYGYESPYVDHMTAKMNEILIKNEATADWIEMRKRAVSTRKNALKILKLEYENFQNGDISKQNWELAKIKHAAKIKKANEYISQMNMLVPSLSLQRGYFDSERDIRKVTNE